MESSTSRIPGFFALSPAKRRLFLQDHALLSEADFSMLDQHLSLQEADFLSENVIGSFALPFSLATNFIIDDKSTLIPFVTEEPSIVAASSKMAKIVAKAGGFHTEIDSSIMKGQVQIYQLPDIDAALSCMEKHREELKEILNQACPRMVERGGGVKNIETRLLFSESIGPMLLVEPRIDVVDAMGANIVNHLMELLGEHLTALLPGASVVLRILSNLSDERLARARCSIPFQLLSTDSAHDFGLEVAEKMLAAHALAEVDPYRACTHNKGIMNGIDAVALATGCDFRALEAGAHAFAARNGRYRALSEMELDKEKGMLHVSLCLPLAVGVVGGNVGAHRAVKVAHKILGPFAKTSRALASVMVSVGLAQCLGALLALSSEGIQKGHMRLHAKKAKKIVDE